MFHCLFDQWPIPDWSSGAIHIQNGINESFLCAETQFCSNILCRAEY